MVNCGFKLWVQIPLSIGLLWTVNPLTLLGRGSTPSANRIAVCELKDTESGVPFSQFNSPNILCLFLILNCLIMLFKRRFSVSPNHKGYLYKKNKQHKTLEPGIYELYDWKRYYHLVSIPMTTNLASVTNQEVLTKDNIALRFSFIVEYAISNPDKFIEKLWKFLSIVLL